ncbi:unnamed protein product, partial [Urochloa humidicola]
WSPADPLLSILKPWHILPLVDVQSPNPILKNSRESVAGAAGMVSTK